MQIERDIFPDPGSEMIWRQRYQRATEADIRDSWMRVAKTVASAEPSGLKSWFELFYLLLSDFEFLPGGRILSNAGITRGQTLLNCFVMGRLDSSTSNLIQSLDESAQTLLQGGGIGLDFSPIWPASSKGEPPPDAVSDPVACLHLWDALCRSITSHRKRSGAMMATLRCDHPDIEQFLSAKSVAGQLSHFNLSVLVTDAFIRAVKKDDDWRLSFGDAEPKTIRAKQLWDIILRNAFEHGEPGVLFIDRINRENNLGYAEDIRACNPCGEVPLPAYGACDLGSINLVRFVRLPFEAGASFDFERVRRVVTQAVRFLDNVIDVSSFPLPQQAEAARRSRRIGLGITALADALIMLRLDYDSDDGRKFAARVLELIRNAAYDASIELAAEKGAFPAFEVDRYLERPFVQRLPQALRDKILRHGIRNSHLLAIAPTGSISLLAGNVSAGIEPVFTARQTRQIRLQSGQFEPVKIEDYAVRAFAQIKSQTGMPPHFATALELSIEAHLAMQATLQPFVDNAISKTINISGDIAFTDYYDVYLRAFDLGLKGCTVYRQCSCNVDNSGLLAGTH